MKTKLLNCTNFNEETFHMVGKKQATSKAKAYTKRTTSQCCQCGTKEINNMRTGKRIIRGKNG